MEITDTVKLTFKTINKLITVLMIFLCLTYSPVENLS